jgi:hypothetical protein
MISFFKFFRGDWPQLPSEPLEDPPRLILDNEQIIRYWNDGDYNNILYERIIAWARGIHVFADNWIQREYQGTMERFFYNRIGLEIPVIQSIEALIPGGSTFTEDDRYYIDNNNFHYPVKIIYYEYETI